MLIHLRNPLPPPLHLAELFAFVSPALGQIRLCTSKIEAEHWVHSCGGVGEVGLEVRRAGQTTNQSLRATRSVLLTADCLLSAQYC
jgi:hypothetical protein